MNTKKYNQKNTFKAFIKKGAMAIFMVVFFFNICCTNKSESNSENESSEVTKTETSIPPEIISASKPVTIKPIHYSPPQFIIIPQKKGGSFIQQAKNGLKTITLLPPETKPAGFFVQMQNYNTEQGLPLSGVFCGYRDSKGNLWFGTDGGGVVRYDGKVSTNFTTSQGLANNVVACITEDKKGNMWFGTDGGGVSFYDGKTFTNYNTTQGLSSNVIRCIVEDKNGNIWVGTKKNGVSRLDFNKRKLKTEEISFTNFTTSKELSNSSVMIIIEDEHENLWFATAGAGAFRLDKNNNNKSSQLTEFTNFKTTDGLINNIVTSIMEDKRGNLWFATNGGGISKMNRDQKRKLPNQVEFKNYTTAQGLLSNYIFCMKEAKNGNIWFGTQGNGVSLYNPSIEIAGGNPFVNYTTNQGLANNDVRSITEDKNGNLWFGTYGGGVSLLSRDGESITNYTVAQGLAYNTIFSINEDRNKNLWFGTYGGGVSKLTSDGKFFVNYNTAQGLANNVILSIVEDNNGNIWFGTDGGGISRLDKGGKSFTNFSTNQGLPDNVVRRILKDRNGNMWFGTDGGVALLNSDGKSFTNYTTAQGLVNSAIWAIKEDKAGNIWFGTQGAGVSKLSADKKYFTNYTTKQGLGDNFVVNIFEDKSGNLWFATAGGGISRFDGKSILSYTVTQGLPDNVVTQILEDKNGKIWIGTNKGICNLTFKTPSGRNRSIIIPGGNSQTNEELKKQIPVFDIYNQQTGHSIKDVNGGQQAMFIDRKGIIWIGTGDDKTALIRFDPSISANHNLKPPNVFIHSIKINEENICWSELSSSSKAKEKDNSKTIAPNIVEEITTFGRALSPEEKNNMREKYADIRFDSIAPFYPIPVHLILPSNHNNVTFDFAATEPAKSFMVRYQYILEGYDKEWSPITDKTTATFGNIYEGNYSFKLKAQSPDGIWSTPITYTFKVLPPWYRTWWAYCIYGLGSFLLLFSINHWRTASLRKDKELLELTVQERTMEVMNQKNEAEKQKSLVEEINKELEKLSIVARETANGVFITDANGNIEWFNEGFSKLFGWKSLEEYKKKRGTNIFDVSGNDNIVNLIKVSIDEKKSVTYENATPTKDQDQLWIQTTLTPIFNQEGQLNKLVFVETDITKLKNSEEQYLTVNKELEAFSFSVSHDLRSPLRAISGYSRILQDDYSSNMDIEGKNALDAIQKNSKKMGELIDDLLAFSRLGRTALTTSEINMTNLVKSVIEEEMIGNSDGIEFIVNELQPSKGTQSLIKQVWVNLISNAIKFSKHNPKARIEVGSYPKDNLTIYYVKDNGAGFDMQYYNKLFGVFQRLHSQNEFEGTGIGLAIVDKIIHRHNGTVWAESKLNEGSSFYFSLPNINS